MGNFLSKIADFVNPLNIITDAVSDIASPIIGLVKDHKNRDLQKATNYQNQQNFEKQLEFNSAEAQAQRDWSAAQADISRQFDTSERLAQQQWQEKMIQQQNEYNSPKAMIERMRAAGVSPATYDGVASSASPSGIPSGSSVGVPSGSSASAPSAPHLSAPRYDFDLAATRLMTAQADKVRAETDKTKEEAENIRQLRSGHLALQKVDINLGQSAIKLNEAQARKAYAEAVICDKKFEELDAQIAEARSRIALLGEQKVAQAFENAHAQELLAKRLEQIESEIKKNDANATLFYGQYNNANALAAYYLQLEKNAVLEGGSLGIQYEIDRDSKKNVLRLKKIETAQAAFDFMYDYDHRETNKWLSLGSQVVGSLSQAAGIAIAVGGLNKVPKVKNSINTFKGTNIPNLSGSIVY